MKTKRKMQTEHFFSPKSGEDQKQKKRSSARIEHFFPKFTLRCKPIQIIGGDAEVDHSQTIGGIQPNYWGDISLPPGFGTTAIATRKIQRTFSFLLQASSADLHSTPRDSFVRL